MYIDLTKDPLLSKFEFEMKMILLYVFYKNDVNTPYYPTGNAVIFHPKFNFSNQGSQNLVKQTCWAKFFKNNSLNSKMVFKSNFLGIYIKKMLATMFFSNSVLFLFETLRFNIKKIWVNTGIWYLLKISELQALFQGVYFLKICFNGWRPYKWCWQYIFSSFIVVYHLNLNVRVK